METSYIMLTTNPHFGFIAHNIKVLEAFSTGFNDVYAITDNVYYMYVGIPRNVESCKRANNLFDKNYSSRNSNNSAIIRIPCLLINVFPIQLNESITLLPMHVCIILFQHE